MSGKAARIVLTEKQQDILLKITQSTTVSQRLLQRARIVMLAFERRQNEDIADVVQLNGKQVGLWRRRWKESFDALVSIECREAPAKLRRAIEDVLSDAPRAGAFGKFTAEQVTQIMGVLCEPPEHSGRPITEWTHRELADEAIKRNIVPSISARQVGRFLKASELQPHRSKYWLANAAKNRSIRLRQNYLRVSKQTAIMVSRYAHAKQFQRMRKKLKQLKTWLERVLRDLRRQVPQPDESLERLLVLCERLHAQEKSGQQEALQPA